MSDSREISLPTILLARDLIAAQSLNVGHPDFPAISAAFGKALAELNGACNAPNEGA